MSFNALQVHESVLYHDSMRLLSGDRKASEYQQGLRVTFENLNQKGHYSNTCMVR